MMKTAVLAVALFAASAQAGDTSLSGSRDTSSSGSKFCSKNYAPVCGTDGKTYSNTCEAEKAGVKSQEGKCQESKCLQCTREFKQVCGIDGVTYSNACLAECKNIRYEDGPCKKEEEEEQEEEEQQDVCPEDYKPVCGSDCKTYSNKCQASKANVRATEGECASTPVCGTDGVTYETTCAAREAEVRSTTGECKEAECICSAVVQEVCGQDGKTYSNECVAICAGVRPDSKGACKDSGDDVVCTKEYVPVCDTATGTTYPNKCAAAKREVKETTEGACKCLRCAQPVCDRGCLGKCDIGSFTFEKCPQKCPVATCVVDDIAKTCTLPNKKEVTNGWYGEVDCNTCKCDGGELRCTKKDCSAEEEEEEEATEPTAGGYCYLSDRTKVKPGWYGAGVGENHCNKCKCSASSRERRKVMQGGEPAVAAALVCTKMSCLIESDTVAVTHVSVTTWSAEKTWEECKPIVRCTEELKECGKCGWDQAKAAEEFTGKVGYTEAGFAKCHSTCRNLAKVVEEEEESKSRDSFGWALKPAVRDAGEVDADTGKSVDGLSRDAAGIKARCAEHTKDCRDDDIDCTCPSTASAIMAAVGKTDGTIEAMTDTFDRAAKKLACCRDVGDKTIEQLQVSMISQMESFVASKGAVVAGIEEQLLDCDASATDADGVVCDTLRLAMESDEETIQRFTLLASSALQMRDPTTGTGGEGGSGDGEGGEGGDDASAGASVGPALAAFAGIVAAALL